MAEFNEAGRAIWFAPGKDGGGTYRPVSPQGRFAFLLVAVWIAACGTICMAGFAVRLNAGWFVAMFAAVAIGLIAFAVQVVRHS